MISAILHLVGSIIITLVMIAHVVGVFDPSRVLGTQQKDFLSVLVFVPSLTSLWFLQTILLPLTASA